MANRNRVVWIGGILVLLILAAGAWAILRDSSPVAQTSDASAAPITITSLRTDVFVKGAGAADFRKVAEHATTTTGATIRTSATGRALIESQAAHATLIDYSSEITLNEEQGNRTRVSLESGAVWSRVQKVFDSGEYYEITSQNAIAAVRGTSFSMSYASDTTTLIVVEGTVAFSAIDPATGAVVPGTEVLVTAGHKAVRAGNGKIVVSPIAAADTQTSWYLFNNPKIEPAPGSVPKPAAASLPPTTTVALPPAPGGMPAQPASPAPATPAIEPRLSSVSPSSITKGSKETVLLRGKNLSSVTRVQVGDTSVSYTVEDDSRISFKADSFKPGTYSIRVVSPGGYQSRLTDAFTITDPNVEAPREYNPNGPY